MKRLLLPLLLLLALSGRAQVFAPVGAEWWYNHSWVAGYELLHATVVGDTLVQGRTCQVISTDRYVWYGPLGYYGQWPFHDRYVVSQQGPRVEVMRANGQFVTGRFEPMVDFGTPVGTSWPVRASCAAGTADSVGTVTVDSVGTILVGGPRRPCGRRRAVGAGSGGNSGDPYSIPYGGMVIERIGLPHAYLFPEAACGIDPEYTAFVGYYEGGVLRYGSAPVLLLGTAPEAALAPVTVAPNPSADGRFSVQGLTEACAYTVSDALGRQVAGGRLAPAAAALDLPQLPAGLYLLRGTTARGQRVNARLVRD